jgi:hypothetical protein
VPSRYRTHRQLAWLLLGTTALGVIALLVVHRVTLIALFVVPATVAALALDPAETGAVAACASAWALVLSLQVHSFAGPGRGSGFTSTVVVGMISGRRPAAGSAERPPCGISAWSPRRRRRRSCARSRPGSAG